MVSQALPTVRVDLLDSKITVGQKKQLAESLTEIVSETLGYQKDRVPSSSAKHRRATLPAAENSDANNPFSVAS